MKLAVIIGIVFGFEMILSAILNKEHPLGDSLRALSRRLAGSSRTLMAMTWSLAVFALLPGSIAAMLTANLQARVTVDSAEAASWRYAATASRTKDAYVSELLGLYELFRNNVELPAALPEANVPPLLRQARKLYDFAFYLAHAESSKPYSAREFRMQAHVRPRTYRARRQYLDVSWSDPAPTTFSLAYAGRVESSFDATEPVVRIRRAGGTVQVLDATQLRQWHTARDARGAPELHNPEGTWREFTIHIPHEIIRGQDNGRTVPMIELETVWTGWSVDDPMNYVAIDTARQPATVGSATLAVAVDSPLVFAGAVALDVQNRETLGELRRLPLTETVIQLEPEKRLPAFSLSSGGDGPLIFVFQSSPPVLRQ